MVAWTGFDSHHKTVYDTFWSTGQAKPTAFKMILTTSSTWDETANTATVTATEISAGNGYSTGGQTLASHTSTFDAAQDRAEGRPADVTFTASGGSLSYDALVVLATIGGSDEICCFYKYGSGQTLADGESLVVTFEGNLGTPSANVTAAD